MEKKMGDDVFDYVIRNRHAQPCGCPFCERANAADQEFNPIKDMVEVRRAVNGA